MCPRSDISDTTRSTQIFSSFRLTIGIFSLPKEVLMLPQGLSRKYISRGENFASTISITAHISYILCRNRHYSCMTRDRVSRDLHWKTDMRRDLLTCPTKGNSVRIVNGSQTIKANTYFFLS